MLVILGVECAPVVNPSASIEPTASLALVQDIKRLTPEEKDITVEAGSVADAEHSSGSGVAASSGETETLARLKRAGLAGAKSDHLESQETAAGYHGLPGGYSSATDSDYGYDSGKNSYGKQASDWSLYDQGKRANIFIRFTSQPPCTMIDCHQWRRRVNHQHSVR